MLNKKLNLSTNIFGKDIKSIPVRDGFGKGILALGEKNEEVVVLSADLAESVRTKEFSRKYPERFFEAGVAEQAMITVASGLANYGKIPFAATFSMFSPGRTWEQIRTTIAINNFPVKIVGAFGGVSVGADGATHQMLEDIALMRVLPNMTVVSVSDALEAEKMVAKVVDIKGPVYLRIPRVESPIYTTVDTPLEIGKANVLWESKDPQVTLVGHGPIIYKALIAAKDLDEMGIGSVVINMHTIKPLDEEILLQYAMTTGSVVTLEDHQIAGGLGSAVVEYLAKSYPVPVEFVGMKDTFGESGKPQELLEKFGLTSRSIIEATNKVVARKRS